MYYINYKLYIYVCIHTHMHTDGASLVALVVKNTYTHTEGYVYMLVCSLFGEMYQNHILDCYF